MSVEFPVRTLDEFLEAAAAAWPRDPDEVAFPSGESVREALTRWWRDVVNVKVTDQGTFQWACTACGTGTSTTDPIYRLPMYEHELWHYCPECSMKTAEPG